MRHFADLTREEVIKMYDIGIQAMVDYSNEIDISGLSECGGHDIYRALITALFDCNADVCHDEWEKAIEAKNICLTMGNE